MCFLEEEAQGQALKDGREDGEREGTECAVTAKASGPAAGVRAHITEVRLTVTVRTALGTRRVGRGVFAQENLQSRANPLLLRSPQEFLKARPPLGPGPRQHACWFSTTDSIQGAGPLFQPWGFWVPKELVVILCCTPADTPILFLSLPRGELMCPALFIPLTCVESVLRPSAEVDHRGLSDTSGGSPAFTN